MARPRSEQCATAQVDRELAAVREGVLPQGWQPRARADWGRGAFDEGCERGVAFVVDLTERKCAEEELRRSRNYLAEAQGVSHTGSWAWSPVSNAILYWSDECYRILGYDPTQGLPSFESSFEHIHPEDRPALTQTIERAVEEKTDFQIEYRLVLPDGTPRNVRILSHPVLDASGKLVEFVGTVMDVTEQKRAEEERREHLWFLESMDRINRAMQRSNDVELMTSGVMQEALEIFACDRACLIYPCDPDAPTYRTVMEHTSPEYGGALSLGQNLSVTPEWGEAVRRVLHHPEAVVDPSVSPGSRERYRVASMLAIAVRPKGDRPYLFAVHSARSRPWTAAEVRLFEETARRLGDALTSVLAHRNLLASEVELRRSQHYLAEAQKLSHTGSWAWGPEVGIKYWSEECYRVQGFDPRDGLPRFEELFQRIHPDDQPKLKDLMQRVVREKIEFETDYRLVRPDGAVRDIHSTAHPVFSPSGDLIEFMGTVIDVTDRKRAEEELRQSEAYLAEAQRLSQTGSWAWSPDQDIRYWSEECYRVLSFNPQHGLPRFEEFFQRIHPDDQPGFRELIQTAIREKAEWEADYRIVHPGGAVRDIHVVGHPVLSTSGHLVEFVGTVIDITERKRAEEELRASERKYRHLVDTTPAFVHTALPNGDLDFFNRGWLEYLGLSITDLLGWRWTSAIHPEDVEELVAKWRAALESGEAFLAEARVRRADGKYRWFLHRKQPQRNEAGEIVKWYGSSIEIEERKIAEEAIRRGEAFLAEGQRLSHTGSWGWNASTGKMTWSQEHFRILGLDPQATNPSLDVFWERVHPDDRIGLRRSFETAIRDKRDFEQEFRVVTPDWSIRHLHGVGHAILNKANELVEFIGSTMDITDRKRAQERAHSQNEAIRMALNAFVEELDVNRFLGDVIAELNKQFHAKSWELWLFDDAIGALVLHSTSHPSESFSPGIGSKNARPLEELQGLWQMEDAARAPQILQLPAQESLLNRRHGESLQALGIKTLLIVPLVLGEQYLGFLELHFQSLTQFTSDDLELAQALVNHATLALQLNRLTRRAEQLAVTEERNRLAREIHDTLAQAFAGVVLHSEALGTSLAVSKRRSAKALSQIQKLARSGLDEARRSVQALRPKALEGSTISEALKQAAKRLAEGGTLSCHFRQRGEPQILSLEAQNELFRIAQEALTNVGKHAQANSVWINLTFTARQVALTIRDNGVGLTATTSAEPKRGYGLGTMRERAQRIGGQLEIESPKNGGTSIRVRVPLAKTDKSIKPHMHQ